MKKEIILTSCVWLVITSLVAKKIYDLGGQRGFAMHKEIVDMEMDNLESSMFEIRNKKS